jgi:RNA polymerase sigma factor (sigma-70 family)
MSEKDSSEHMLLDRCIAGEPEALDELLNNYRKRAFSYAVRLTRHVEDAEDLVSIAFVRVSRAITRFKLNASFSTWMIRIIKNCFLDQGKARRINIVASLDASLDLENGNVALQPISKEESAFDLAARNELCNCVKEVIQTLPIEHQMLLHLRYVDDLTYSEISDKLHVPAGTVKSRLHRSKALLYDSFVDSGGYSTTSPVGSPLLQFSPI